MKTRSPALLAAFLATLLLALACYSPIYKVELSSAYKGGSDHSGKAILSFAFSTPAANGVVSEATHSIAVTVPFGTNVTALIPTIVQTGASVIPASGVAQDFTSPVVYTVTAADSSTQSYTVTVTVASSSTKTIDAFSFAAPPAIGFVTEATHSIAVTVPFGTNVTSLVPTISYTGLSISPGTSLPQNFSGPVVYTVTAPDYTTQAYTVTVTIAPNSAKAITSFDFTALGASGVVTEASHTVAISVPYGTNVTSLIPTITITGSSVSPNTGVAQNFTSPVVYTVTANDSSTQAYTVTVTILPDPAKDITSFAFTASLNAPYGIVTDCSGSIAGNSINVVVPYGVAWSNLIASFSTTGANVKIGAVTQTSGITANDFSLGPVIYTVTAADASTKSYTVTVTMLPNPAKDITSFVFTSASNASLPSNCTGSIIGTNISVSVPYGTSLSSLIPTIAITGASVSPGSGLPMSFISPATYTVTAADSTTKAYTVTVTALPNPAKAITAFNFSTPPATGVVTEATHTIAITVPYGTNVTALVPTIACTGISVGPGSGVARDFTSPVVYVVTAADLSTQNYTVTVTVAAASSFRISAIIYNGPIWSSSDGGATWFSGGPSLNWTNIAGSSDGTKLLANAGASGTSSNIYRSSDGGVSWNILASAGSYPFIGMGSSDDGSILGATVYDGTYLFYYSKDSGTTWNTTATPGARYWTSAMSSSNGLNWIAYDGGDTNTNVSIWSAGYDGASTWNFTRTSKGWSSEGGVYPNGLSITKDGTRFFATFATTAYLSPDFGTTWNPLPLNPGTPMSGSVMSGDGSKLAVVVNETSIYTSTNGGSSWFLGSGLPGAPYLIRNPVCSYDGTKIAVLALYNGSPANSYIYLSTDGGASFAAQTGPGAAGQSYWNGLYIQSQ